MVTFQKKSGGLLTCKQEETLYFKSFMINLLIRNLESLLSFSVVVNLWVWGGGGGGGATPCQFIPQLLVKLKWASMGLAC